MTVVALLAQGCSSFVGLQPDASTDAPASELAPQPDASAMDDSVPADVVPSRCGAGRGACDPVEGTGCGSGQDCRISDFVSLQTVCGAAGASIAGASCQRESDCGPGLHCLTPPGGVCARLCCAAGGTPGCVAAFGNYSSCSVATNSFLVNGCTVNNACDYLAQRGCSPGLQCAPTNEGGASRCFAPGPSGPGEPCMTQLDCAAGNACASAGPSSPGACRPLCNPAGANACEAGFCRGFAQRPGDWGACQTQ